MDQFVSVYFGPNEREKQREFLLAMNGVGIIQVTQDEIEHWFQEDVKANAPGCTNNIVLHNADERQRFIHVMDIFFPNKEYKITDAPGTKEFKEWLERKNAQTSH